jgi:hypothetical protein
MRFAEWESFKRSVRFAEKSSRRWIAKTNIAVPNALKKQIGKNRDVSKKIQPSYDRFLKRN